MQLIVCMSHLYGDTLYYATSLFDDYVNGVPYCRPEPYYFWLYYFFMNFIWIVIPGCMYSQVLLLLQFLLHIAIDKANLLNRLFPQEYLCHVSCYSSSAGVRRATQEPISHLLRHEWVSSVDIKLKSRGATSSL